MAMRLNENTRGRKTATPPPQSSQELQTSEILDKNISHKMLTGKPRLLYTNAKITGHLSDNKHIFTVTDSVFMKDFRPLISNVCNLTCGPPEV